MSPLTIDEIEGLQRLGRTVRLARLRRGLSQDDLAARLGISRRTLTKLEAGDPGIALGTIAKACSVFGYPERLGELLASDPTGEVLDAGRGSRARTDDGWAGR